MSKLADDLERRAALFNSDECLNFGLEDLPADSVAGYGPIPDDGDYVPTLLKIAPHLPALLRALENRHRPRIAGHGFPGYEPPLCPCPVCVDLEGAYRALLEAADGR